MAGRIAGITVEIGGESHELYGDDRLENGGDGVPP